MIGPAPCRSRGKCLPWNCITRGLGSKQNDPIRSKPLHQLLREGLQCLAGDQRNRGDMAISIFWPAMPAQRLKARFSILEISAVGTLASVLRQSPRAIKIRYFPVTA